MKRWDYLVEADDALRKAEAAYNKESSDEATVMKYVALLRRSGDRRRGDTVENIFILNNAYRGIGFNKPDAAEVGRIASHYTTEDLREMLTELNPNRVNVHLLNSVFSRELRRANGDPQEWRISGKVTTWKTRPTHFRVLVKYGLYNHGYLTHENTHQFSRDEDDAR